MKRRLAKITLLLSALLLVAGGALLLWPQDKINKASWKQIQLGMSENEVNGILGGPGLPWNHPWEQPIHMGSSLREPNNTAWKLENPKCWMGRRGYMEIQFDEGGNVAAKLFRYAGPTDWTFVDRVRDWLGL
jgi:hypothetical protein